MCKESAPQGVASLDLTRDQALLHKIFPDKARADVLLSANESRGGLRGVAPLHGLRCCQADAFCFLPDVRAHGVQRQRQFQSLLFPRAVDPGNPGLMDTFGMKPPGRAP